MVSQKALPLSQIEKVTYNEKASKFFPQNLRKAQKSFNEKRFRYFLRHLR